MNLAANRPRAFCTSRYPQYQGEASKLGRALNRYAESMYLEEILQDIVRDAFFLMGIAKVSQSDSSAITLESDYRSDPGVPFVERISIKRFVRDPNADSPEEAAFLGNCYDVSFSRACKSARFPAWARAKIKEVGPNPHGDDDNPEPPLEDTLTLCDVFIRSLNAVWTFVCDSKFNLRIDEPIQRVKWTGEECGPYFFLSFGLVPDRFYPSSPGQNGRLLQQLFNTCYRKLEDQARRMKMVGHGNQNDVEQLRDALDGSWITLTQAAEAGQIRLDGPDQNLFAYCLNVLEQYSAANGNLKFKLGQGQSADTASQERLIGGNVSRTEASNQARYVSFVRKVMRALAKLIWQDTSLQVSGYFSIPGTDISVSDHLMPAGVGDSRVGLIEHYLIDIEPESMPYRSSGDMAMQLRSEMQMWMGALPYLGQLGTQPNTDEYFTSIADLTNNQALKRIFQSNQPVQTPPTGGEQVPSAGGPREYVHRSVGSGGGSDPNQAALSMMQSAQADNNSQSGML